VTTALLLPAVGLLAIAGGVHLVLLAHGTFRTWLALLRTPTSSIEAAITSDPLIEITGTVLAPELPLRDALTGAACVYYQHGPETHCIDFVVDDGTGRARVELDDAIVLVRGGGDLVIAPGEKVYLLGPATRLPEPDAAGATLRLRATRKRALFVAELSEHAAGRRLGVRAAIALTVGGLLVLMGVMSVLLQAWLVWARR